MTTIPEGFTPKCDRCGWVGMQFKSLIVASQVNNYSHDCTSDDLQNQRHSISIIVSRGVES